ncbi:MAG: hypothetical protein ACM3ML_31145 [Micromonosporaceae bacterium]
MSVSVREAWVLAGIEHEFRERDPRVAGAVLHLYPARQGPG